MLLVHGGPWSHDTWGYNPEAQFLANRGYAVLQVNFRGSTGYGRRHITAAIGEFAGAMHDDLIDAVDWAVAQGYADPARIGIYGGSYGGYAALVGVTVTPDYFAAAVDYVGISDLANFLRTLPPFTRPLPRQQLVPLRRRPRRPRAGGRHARPLADHHGRPDPHPAAGRPGRQRRPRRAGRVRQHRRRRCASAASRSSTSSPRTRGTASPTPRTGCGSTARSSGTSPSTSAAAAPERMPDEHHHAGRPRGGTARRPCGPGPARRRPRNHLAIRRGRRPA